MADIVTDGRTRVAFIPSIANLVAATLTELNAGTLIQDTLTPEGLEGFENSQADVDNTSMGSVFDSTLPGRASFANTGLMLKKQDGTDVVYNLLTTPGTNGFIVVRDELLADTAWASGQNYEVYPIRTGIHNKMGRNEKNALLRYRVKVNITSFKPSYLKGVVA